MLRKCLWQIYCHSHPALRWWCWLSGKCASHSLSVDYRKGWDEIVSQKNCNSTHILKITMRLNFRQMCNVTHFLLIIENKQQDFLIVKKIYKVTDWLLFITKDVMRLLLRTKCDVTYKLLIIGWNCLLEILRCYSHAVCCGERYGEAASKKESAILHTNGKKGNETPSRKLLMTLTPFEPQKNAMRVDIKDIYCFSLAISRHVVMGCLSIVQCHSQTVG